MAEEFVSNVAMEDRDYGGGGEEEGRMGAGREGDDGEDLIARLKRLRFREGDRGGEREKDGVREGLGAVACLDGREGDWGVEY